MPLPSEADIRAAIGKSLILDSDLYAYLATQANNWVAREQTYLDAIPSDSAPGAQAAQQAYRALLASALDPALRQQRLAPLWATYGRVVALPPGQDFFARLFKYFDDNSYTVKNRAFSFGSWSAGGSNVGTGTIKRLTKDQDNYTIESGFAEDKRAECIIDAHSGAQRHEEVFWISGEQSGRDGLERIGTGRGVRVECLSSRKTESYVRNPSFEAVTLSGSTLTDITGWTVGSSINNFETVTSDYYKDLPNASTSRSLRIKTNDSIYQSFADVALRWPRNVPLYAQIAFKRESSCDGNLNIIIGNVTTTVALSAQSGWTVLTFDIDDSAWFKNWNADAPSLTPADAAIKISLDSNTTGDLLIDDFILGPYTNVDGAWVALIGGATPFLAEDVFTVTDTSSDTGLIQTWLARTYGVYLPHTSGAATWADPS